MLFTSFEFLVLALATFSLYYFPPFRRVQVPILVIASFAFYAWNAPSLLVLLIVSILINVLTSYKVAHSTQKTGQLFWAFWGVFANLLVLGLFKYGGLFTRFFLHLAGATTVPEDGLVFTLLTLPLPIGISFYTFQGISLVVDVLRQSDSETSSLALKEKFYVQIQPLKYLLNTSFFLAFFPQLIAGPIVKANEFFPQISPKRFRDIPWALVFKYLVLGYFLKMVVADNLKDYTFWITYPYYQGLGTLTNLTLLFGYSMQIFADFAGYSLIAIGLGAAFGYTLPQNFNFPYISCSIAEFWRRWHISLSTWLKSYLYIPLGGNRKGKIRTYFNLIIVMVLGGLWHGAAWSYAVWGLFHGVGLAIERLCNLGVQKRSETGSHPTWQQHIIELFQVLSVFSFVTFGWLLFKLPRFDQALDFVAILFKNVDAGVQLIYIVPVLIFSAPVLLYHLPHYPAFRKTSVAAIASSKTRWTTLAIDLTFGLMLAMLLLNSGSSTAFIYFQF
jgi:alginate O-acetyltransferase complex protein AlgI